ncbi:hypothetical protein [Rubritepida flocculans]|uniref:hypothetical protein n=1 Tax=Rubritepida flocculans TaxID=182403 RepID=UPI0003FBCF99|nr:hypothetical protein [Rubritepida flocculans]
MPLISLLRQGMLLSLGWIVAATLLLRHHGFLWALLVLILWAALLVRFQRSTVEHARAIAALRKDGNSP